MYLFYTPDMAGEVYTLTPEESKHCIRVLRLAAGAPVSLVDGRGNWYNGTIERPDARGCGIRITEHIPHYGKRPFRLHLAIAPTKNSDRIEWMLEKCTEIGIDEITLLHTEHAERKTVKAERLEKIMIAAMKQSLKAYLPRLNPLTDFNRFIASGPAGQKLIAHCHPGDKKRLDELYRPGTDAVILIGPEGDFSETEAAAATAAGFTAITLGNSRLRTETAGIVACHSVNFINKI